MLIEEELARSSPEKDTLLTIGVFDGVHLGHKYLISQLTEQARQQNLLAGVVTFRQHPQEVLLPKTKLPFLIDLDRRAAFLQSEGVDTIVFLSFTPELARLSASQFVSLLRKYLGMKGLVVGPDFALGQNREGTIDTLRQLGQDMNFTLTVIPPVMINGDVVSSTAIRKVLAEGDMKKAVKLMGRPFSLRGRVISGAGRGTRLGFPTANLAIGPKQALPDDGVYATWAYVDGKAYQAVTNIGKQPTFGGKKRTVEVYVLDYLGNLYGRQLEIDIVERLRREKRFETADQLKRQIAEDVKQGKAVLNSQGRS